MSHPLEDDVAAAEFRIVIAGGGVAALEAALAFAEQRRPGIEVELVCPEQRFALRPLAVVQPFGGDPPPSLDLAKFTEDTGIELRRDGLAEVWGRQRLLLDSGEEIFFDALLLATGARPFPALPGAEVFRGPIDAPRFAATLAGLEDGSIRSLAFAVPGEVRWSLPLYELALLTAHRLRSVGVAGAQLTVVTHEEAPLGLFGTAGSDRIAELLDDAGIALHLGAAPERFDGGRLELAGGDSLDVGHVIALPTLRVPLMPGLPQGRDGFIGTDAEMRVEGLERVWAVGDANWFPIKQGGLAAQQAEVAAASILRTAGLPVDQPAFTPVLRGALLTGDEPEFLRAEIGGDLPAAISRAPLWWPPSKIAGPRLAPYLARMLSGEPGDPLIPLSEIEPAGEDRALAAERDHRASVEISLTSADVHAREGELEQALHWLDIAEKLNVTLPEEYAERRRRWREEVRADDDR
jgi:sulfide:quinone oxidoreductase